MVHIIFSDNKSVKLACNSDEIKTVDKSDFFLTISYQLIQVSLAIEALYTRQDVFEAKIQTAQV